MTLLERLWELDKQSAPGPWTVSANGHVYMGRWFGLIAKVVNDNHEEAALIVESRNALPALLAVVDAAQDVQKTPGRVSTTLGAKLDSLYAALDALTAETPNA